MGARRLTPEDFQRAAQFAAMQDASTKQVIMARLATIAVYLMQQAGVSDVTVPPGTVLPGINVRTWQTPDGTVRAMILDKNAPDPTADTDDNPPDVPIPPQEM